MTGLEEVERDHIVRALEASNWVVGGRNGAAERLGMKRTSLVYRMRKLRISPAAAPAKRYARQTVTKSATNPGQLLEIRRVSVSCEARLARCAA